MEISHDGKNIIIESNCVRDKDGRELEVGDIIKIEKSYIKANNGIYRVTNKPMEEETHYRGYRIWKQARGRDSYADSTVEKFISLDMRGFEGATITTITTIK